MKLIVSRRAARNIEKIQAWWVEHRPAAPTAFTDELAAAEALLRTEPDAGLVYAVHRSGTVRRVVLVKTRHHLYYRHRPDREEIVVLAVWGSPRERGPKL